MLTAPSSTGWKHGTNLFTGVLPEQPDKAACIYDRGGDEPQPSLEGGQTLEAADVQLLVRHAEYVETFILANQIDRLLQLQRNNVYEGVTYVLVFRTTHPEHLCYDEKQRSVVAVNYRVLYINQNLED